MIPFAKLQCIVSGPFMQWEPVYNHINTATGERTYIAIRRLEHWLPSSGIPVVNVALAERDMERLIESGGIEPEHLATVTRERLRDPIIYAEWEPIGDGNWNVCLIDGAHRALVAFFNGIGALPSYIVPRKAWERFTIGDIPDDVVMRSPAEISTRRNRRLAQPVIFA